MIRNKLPVEYSSLFKVKSTPVQGAPGREQPNRGDAAGGKYILPNIIQIYGNMTQCDSWSQYRGNQCTSMSTAAIIYWTCEIRKRSENFDPIGINQIIVEGDLLHTCLREDKRLSEIPDGRISLEDIPHQDGGDIEVAIFNRRVRFRTSQVPSYVLLTSRPGFADWSILADHLSSSAANMAVGFLLTVRSYTYAIFRDRPNVYTLFDSHGHFERFYGNGIKRAASVYRFPSFSTLEAFLVKAHGADAHCLIAQLIINPATTKAPITNTNMNSNKQIHNNPNTTLQQKNANAWKTFTAKQQQSYRDTVPRPTIPQPEQIRKRTISDTEKLTPTLKEKSVIVAKPTYCSIVKDQPAIPHTEQIKKRIIADNKKLTEAMPEVSPKHAKSVTRCNRGKDEHEIKAKQELTVQNTTPSTSDNKKSNKRRNKRHGKK